MGAIVEIEGDAWMTEVTNLPTFRVAVAESAARSVDIVREHAAAHPRSFYYTKVVPGAVDQVGVLCAIGFSVVDVHLTFVQGGASPDATPRATPAPVVRDFERGDAEEVLAIAGSNFEHSRFHVDPRYPRALADTVKREWTRNCLLGRRGDRVRVALHEGRPAAFLASLTDGAGAELRAVIDLVAVDRRHRRRGFASALVDDFVSHYRPSCQVLQVGTQLGNDPSIGLYQRAGFALTRGEYVLHLHTPAGV